MKDYERSGARNVVITDEKCSCGGNIVTYEYPC